MGFNFIFFFFFWTFASIANANTQITLMAGSPSPGRKVDNESAKLNEMAKLLAMTEEDAPYVEDKWMMHRHLRADKGKVASAAKRFRVTLEWRKSFGVLDLLECFRDRNPNPKIKALEEILVHENSTGKIYTRGMDRFGRAIMIMRPQCENTKSHDNQMKHLVWNLEKAIATSKKNTLCCDGDGDGAWEEKIVIMFDYNEYKLSSAPPMRTAKETISILQNHYPERLFKAYFIRAPLIFRGFFKIVSPFIDPVSKEKLNFLKGGAGESGLEEEFESGELETFAGGVGGNYGRKNEKFDSSVHMRELPFGCGLEMEKEAEKEGN